ncbi:MAG: alpha-L-fucosidase [Planctomycetota bacterium]
MLPNTQGYIMINKSAPKPQSVVSYAERTAWFHESRFGLFIHYGLFSSPGRGEWLMFNERVHPDKYARLVADFRPEPEAAKGWVELAVRSGMKYAVLTTRHHDGFSLFGSEANGFNSVTHHGRDLVGEFVDACRAGGLRVGLYYSLLDWRFPGYFEPGLHPESAEALRQQVHAELRQLMTDYGRIDLLWYDGGWIDHGRKSDGDPAAYTRQVTNYWDSFTLNQMVYDLQPTILINNRSGIDLDLDTPEQEVKASEAGRAWEACMTIGDSTGWGWLRDNPNRKTTATLLQNLVQAAAGEGNFLINIGPDSRGRIDEADRSRLEAMGQWLTDNGEAIYGSQRCDLYDQRMPGAPLGRWTRQGKTAYLHLFRWPGPKFVVPLIDQAPRSARLLGQPITVFLEHDGNDPIGRLHVNGLPEEPPTPHVNVLVFEFEQAPLNHQEPDHSAWLR